MGLDWNPGNRPKPGHEEEFVRLYYAIDDTKSDIEREALLERFQEISITAFETLGAPRVGHDAAADDWIREKFEQNKPDIALEEWMEQFKDFWVLPLVPRCDGLPWYTNGSPGGYVEQYAFRGKFLDDCEHIIGDELLQSGYVSKLPDELLQYGKALIERAEAFAAEKVINLAELDQTMPKDPDSDEFRLHVVVSAGRWCIFWAERGHFLDSYW